jgi:hypothetical protein
LLSLGQTGAAAAAVESVPVGFVYEAQYSAVSYELYNLAWDMNIDWHEVTIGETYRNVMTEGMPDPRITAVDNGVVDNSSGIAVWE